MFNMALPITIIVIISIVALVLTLALAGKSDDDYDKSSKKNVTQLSLIYVVAILGSIVALIIFIYFFT
ncbi:hypothetical protein [Radiobacillus sp. PE A8.2]|uniref:hypothetical protein n=1 Tax=Radiobacillus sp. PE A8.2 TaxID=3380349 RepID=UPI00388FF8A6